MLSNVLKLPDRQGSQPLGKSLSKGRAWLGLPVSLAIVVAAGAVAATAAVVSGGHGHGHGHRHGHAGRVVICQRYARRTVHFRGVGYIVRNDVFYPERECITLQKHAVGFVVTSSRANSHVDNNEAFPEVVYGCAWGVCTYHSSLPRKVYRIRVLRTSLSTSWRRAEGRFNVAYDIWFGHLHEYHGQVRGAEMMIWLGTKRFGVPASDPIARLDGQRWYYARHLACNQFGCWNYVLFRRVVATTSERRLSLLPFISYAESRRQLSYRWFLKSVDAGFEIWQRGKGLTIHSYLVRLRLKTVKQHPGKRN